MSVFIVAEAGVNHLGDRAKMLALCDAAKAAGADAVKFQAYNAMQLSLRRSYAVRDGQTVTPFPAHQATCELLSAAELSDADLDAIAAHCKNIDLKWFASVFDPSQIERVLSRGACALKVAHPDAQWELIQACSAARDQHGVPVYVSSAEGHTSCRLGEMHSIHCIAEYPAVSHPRLGHMLEYCEGFSSHYATIDIPVAAARLLGGKGYLECHLKLSDTDPEAAWSLNTADFTAMVKLIREYEHWL